MMRPEESFDSVQIKDIFGSSIAGGSSTSDRGHMRSRINMSLTRWRQNRPITPGSWWINELLGIKTVKNLVHE